MRGEPLRERARRLRIVRDIDDQFRGAGFCEALQPRGQIRAAYALRERLGRPAESNA